MVVLLGLLACTGDDDPPATGTTASTGDTGGGVPTFTRVRTQTLAGCDVTGCHASAASGNGFSFEGDLHAELVDAPSEFAPGEILVIPGDADGSYIVKKLEGAPGIVDDPMPPPLGGFDPRKLDELRAWIDAGALDN